MKVVNSFLLFLALGSSWHQAGAQDLGELDTGDGSPLAGACLIRHLHIPPLSVYARWCQSELLPHAREIFATCQSGNLQACATHIRQVAPQAEARCGRNAIVIAKAVYRCIGES
ncbi:hypothetical protein [Oligoflexus tunisiensis]|uniref:hypothetical protein n=1 Tax=Oligoflexus tunisiensis TaxID=708132 RepID=UPI00114D173A|nr:hypothetical protein [Oligoflexus tunisiensis]